MADISGVCVLVPLGQNGFRPQVYGMGIVVTRRAVVTCAHVINTALGPRWWAQQFPGRVRISFPFAGGACLEGVVSRDLWFPPGRETSSGLSDVAVIGLADDVPAGVGIARFARPGPDMAVKAYGFRGEYRDGVWVSHPDGQWVVATVVGPQPGGRAQLDGLRTTGARVEKGFSGGGVYSSSEDAVVGMIVESDKDVVSRVAQFTDASEIMARLGGLETLSSFVRVQAAKNELIDVASIAKRKAVRADGDLQAFVGRENEEEQFKDRLSQAKGHMHFVGHGGIGKSSLLRRLASLAEGQEVSTAYVDLGFVHGPLDLVRKLVFALLSSGSCELPRYLECINRYAVIENYLLSQPGLKHRIVYYLSKLRELMPTLESDMDRGQASLNPDVGQFSSNDSFAVYEALSAEDREFFANPLPAVVDAFAEDVGSERMLFEFDRTERISQPIGEWLMRYFVPLLDHVVTVSAGRDDISSTWGLDSGTVRVFELHPLSDDESENLLRIVGVLDQQVRRRVATISRGVPLALVLAAEVAGNVNDQAVDPNVDSYVDSYVVDRMIHVFLDGISDARRQALQRLSVFRRFNREAVLDLAICDSSTIDAMLKVRFIRHVPYGYAVHDRVRDFILRDLRRHQPQAYRLLHEEAAEHFHARMGPYTDGNLDYLEWLYHELSAHPSEAFEQVRRDFTSAALAIKPDFCEALISVARESDVGGGLPRLWLRFFEGSIRRQRFDFRGAGNVYEEILRDPDIEHHDELKAELLYQRSVALWYLCRFEEAREVAQTSVTLNHSLEKAFFENRSLGIVGLSLDRMGRFAEATRAVQRMARQAGDEDPVSRGYALNSVGYFSWHSGHWRRTERALQESLETWRSMKNPVGECYPLGHLGLLYSATGRQEMAWETLERAERMCRLTGNLEMLAKTLQNLSHYYRRIGTPDKAVELGRESLEVCERMKHPYFAADSLRLLSEAYLDLDDFAAAEQAVTAGLERLPGALAAYLHLRLRVADALVRVQRIVADGGNAQNEVEEDLIALVSSAAAAGFRNLAAEATLGQVRLASFRESSRTLKYFESGAGYAFTYNWYAGMYYLERSKHMLLTSEGMSGVADMAVAMFGESRLRQLYRAAHGQALRSAVEVDHRRLSAFARGAGSA